MTAFTMEAGCFFLMSIVTALENFTMEAGRFF
jgi:hypothetical protein